MKENGVLMAIFSCFVLYSSIRLKYLSINIVHIYSNDICNLCRFFDKISAFALLAFVHVCCSLTLTMF